MPRSQPAARFPIFKATLLPDTQSILPETHRSSSVSSLIPAMRISELRLATPLAPPVAAAEPQPQFILLLLGRVARPWEFSLLAPTRSPSRIIRSVLSMRPEPARQ